MTASVSQIQSLEASNVKVLRDFQAHFQLILIFNTFSADAFFNNAQDQEAKRKVAERSLEHAEDALRCCFMFVSKGGLSLMGRKHIVLDKR